MKKMIKKLFKKKPYIEDVDRKDDLSPFFDVGFHGDEHLIKIIFLCMSKCEQFIETGSSVGSSIRFLGSNFTKKPCYSCEPHNKTYEFASDKCSNLKNVVIKNEASPEFLYNLKKEIIGFEKKDTVFWLDSHGRGFRWPLREEIAFITSEFDKAYIFIDDFKVPENPQFGYDEYDGQICEYEYIRESFNKSSDLNVYYPNYHDITSDYHPLRGWILIEFGHDKISFLDDYKLMFKKND